MQASDKEIPVRTSNPLQSFKALTLSLLFCAAAAAPASAQTGAQTTGQTSGATVATPSRASVLTAGKSAPAARSSEVVFAGFIEQTPPTERVQIVGAENERTRRIFAQGDLVFIDAGAQSGVKVGQEFSVVRPRGQFRSKFSRKGGSLGVFTQEVGLLRVVRVRDRVSVAEVIESYGNLLLGDLLRPFQRREAPVAREDVRLDVFAEPSGKQTGRIVLTRDGRETVSRDQVVYIDLGAEDNLKVGDHLTVFRPDGHGTFVKYGDEIVANYRGGFESDELRGGGFSNQAQRLKNAGGSKRGRPVKTPQIKHDRPPVPREVVGELVVLRVEGRTATAVVTRVAREIHTGDAVELQ